MSNRINIKVEEYKGNKMLVIEEVQERESRFRPRTIQFGQAKAQMLVEAEAAVKKFAEGINPVTNEALPRREKGSPTRPRIDTNAELPAPKTMSS